MCVQLKKMSLPLLRQFFSGFTPDPDTFLNDVPKTIYNSQYIEHTFDKQRRPDRRHFAIVHEDVIIGDLYLKHINTDSGSCTLSIQLIKNERSCHVLEKVGFVEICRDQEKRYFCCQKP